jgi:hypothetical protein
MLMSEHKKDNWYVDSRAYKHVAGNWSLIHDIVETHSSSSVRLVKRHAHGVEGKGHAKFWLNGSIKENNKWFICT